MSTHIIYFKDGAKMMRRVGSRQEYLSLRDSQHQQQLMSRIRSGESQLKTQLVQMNYSCLPNADGTLKGSTRMSTTVGMDIDHLSPTEMTTVKERILSKKSELGLLMLEESARGQGYHLVFGRHAELTQEENLQWASQLLQVPFDSQAKDITRVFFTTAQAQLLYLDDSIFSSEEVSGTSSEEEVSGTDFTDFHGSGKSASDDNPCSKEYRGIPYSEIIAKYWELFNGGKEPTVGDRNALTFELAVTLRSICGYSLQQMEAVVPNYWMRPDGTCTPDDMAEYRQTLENAQREPRRGMPYRMRQVLGALKEQQRTRACGGTTSTPPPLPKRLPPLIRLLTRNVPDLYKPAVASAIFPALGAHLHGVHFRYWDNVDHEATFMHLLVGRQSVGKGSIKKPIEYVLEDIRQRDLLNRQREADWKQKNPASKQKKDPRPQDICIQILIDNLTDAVFNQRVVDAHNNGQRYIYTLVDEVEALKKVTSSHKADEVGLLIRKAFDNSMAGQERVGADSVSGIAPLRWNFNASTTPPNARRFFSKMVNDGTISRLDTATIIIPPEAEDQAPVMGLYDDAFTAELKPYLDRLEAASGLIECSQSRQLSLTMREENADNARLYESEAYRVLSYRANVIAWLKGMVLYVAQGYRWDKTIADFVRWSQQYNLWCKMLYFGQQLEQELADEQEIQRHSGPQNLLELLPDEFTREQYLQMRHQAGRPGSGDSTLRTWIARGHIALDETTKHFVKIEKRKN